LNPIKLIRNVAKSVIRMFVNYSSVSRVLDNLYVGDISLLENRKIAIDLGIDFILDARFNFDSDNDDWEINWNRLERFTDGAIRLLQEGYTIAIYCYGGIDRSPFVTAVILSKYRNLPFPKAYQIVMKKRPQTMWHGEWELEYMNRKR